MGRYGDGMRAFGMCIDILDIHLADKQGPQIEKKVDVHDEMNGTAGTCNLDVVSELQLQ